MTEEVKKKGPLFKGVIRYFDQAEGFAVWVADDWRKIDMVKGHRGWIFTPYPDRYDTCFTCEKVKLRYKSKPEDAEILMEGFEAGINQMPDVLVEYKNCDVGLLGVILEAKFTFTENGQRRKRWVKTIYWAESSLVLIAQGATVDEYAYWEGMLYNAMMNYELI